VSNDYCDYLQPAHLITEVIVVNLCYILTFLVVVSIQECVLYNYYANLDRYNRFSWFYC